MSNTIKYIVSQDKSSKRVTLEVFRNNGETKDDWIMYEKIEDLKVEELRKLKDYLCSIFKKKDS